LAGTASQGALELHQGAADLVAEGGVALLVVDDAAAAEDVAATGAGGGGVGGVVDHFGGWFWVSLGRLRVFVLVGLLEKLWLGV